MDSPNPSTVTTTVPADLIISSLLSFPNSSPISISCSFDQALDKALASVSGDDDTSVHDRLVDRTLELASLLLDSTKRCFRKRATVHNSKSWFLPPELTIKVFSMLDTKSLMQMAACCSMFYNCAMDRLSYSQIDLTTSAKNVDDAVVCTMIHRAGKELRSLKVGALARPAGSDLMASSLLTRACLSPLSYNQGFLGSRLRSLHLYNLRPMDYNTLTGILSYCSNITDLRIVGLCNPSYMHLFKLLAIKCRLIEHLCLETNGFEGPINTSKGSPLVELVTNCSNLTSLTLIRFGLTDETVRNLAKNARKLKYMNLSESPVIKGRFLRDLGLSCKDGSLKSLILRNCPSLEEKEVLGFCNSLLNGDVKSIRHIDVSGKRSFGSNGRKRSSKPNFPLEKLKEERPGVTFVVDSSLTSSGKRFRVCDEVDDEELRLIEMIEAKKDGVHEDYSDSGSDDGENEEDDESNDSEYLL